MDRTYKYAERLMSVDKVGVQYGDKVILRDVTLKIDNVIRPGVKQGQTIALLGPSGVGKTQLFRAIAGFQKPSSGGVFLNGHAEPVVAGQVGVVQQNYPLLNHRTIAGNLEFVTKDKARIDDLLTRFGLIQHKTKYPSQLSGGQRQRVAIIQQLLRNSHFILMDEPFSGLDILAKQAVMDLIREVSRIDELNTTIFTTHDIECAVGIADHIWILGREEGKVGATVRYELDLIEDGLAWSDHPEKMPQFHSTVDRIKELFKTL